MQKIITLPLHIVDLDWCLGDIPLDCWADDLLPFALFIDGNALPALLKKEAGDIDIPYSRPGEFAGIVPQLFLLTTQGVPIELATKPYKVQVLEKEYLLAQQRYQLDVGDIAFHAGLQCNVQLIEGVLSNDGDNAQYEYRTIDTQPQTGRCCVQDLYPVQP